MMYASYSLSSSSPCIATTAHLSDQGIELRCSDLRTHKVSPVPVSSGKFPDAVRRDLAPLLAQIQSQTPPIAPDAFRQAAIAMGTLLERCCAEVESALFVVAEHVQHYVTLRPSTAWQRRKELTTLIQNTREKCVQEIQSETLLYPAHTAGSSLLEVVDVPALGRASSLEDAARHAHVSRSPTPGSISPAQGSSAQDSRKDHPTGQAPSTAKESVEMRYAQELYKLTRLANTKSPWRIYAVLPFAMFAPITSLASLILSTNVPLCSDSTFSAYMNHIRGLDCGTASLAIAALITSFLSRTAFLPKKRLPVYDYSNPSRLELDPAETATIEARYSGLQIRYPDCLLPSHMQQVRKNMQELAKQTEIEWSVCCKIRRDQGLPPAQSSCIQHVVLSGAQVVSLTNICGMFLTAASAGLLAWVRASKDVAEQACPANTMILHDDGKDLTNYAIAPFITTVIGCALLCIDAYRKHSQRQTYLEDRIPQRLSAGAL